MREFLNVLGKIKESIKPCFQSQQKEVTEINKDGNENAVTISYQIKFIDSARFMATSLSNLLDNLKKGIHKM